MGLYGCVCSRSVSVCACWSVCVYGCCERLPLFVAYLSCCQKHIIRHDASFLFKQHLLAVQFHSPREQYSHQSPQSIFLRGTDMSQKQ